MREGSENSTRLSVETKRMERLTSWPQVGQANGATISSGDRSSGSAWRTTRWGSETRSRSSRHLGHVFLIRFALPTMVFRIDCFVSIRCVCRGQGKWFPQQRRSAGCFTCPLSSPARVSHRRYRAQRRPPSLPQDPRADVRDTAHDGQSGRLEFLSARTKRNPNALEIGFPTAHLWSVSPLHATTCFPCAGGHSMTSRRASAGRRCARRAPGRL